MSYQGIRVQDNTNFLHLGGNCVEGDPYTYSPSVWKYLIDRFSIESMLDVGGGLGYCANFFFKRGIKTVSMDGLDKNIKNAFYPTIKWDLLNGPFITSVDLVHCQEVVEHLEEKYVQNLIETFKSGRYICMTHADINQPGEHHVNCQPTEYWIQIMENNNCYLLEEDTKRIREIAFKDNSGYLISTGLIFCNRDF